jgi:hypothetical protein
MFPALYLQASQAESLVEGVRDNLAAINYPNDATFRRHFIEAQMYASSTRDRAKLILERLESSLSSKEIVPFEDLSVEHVMPQTLTPWWTTHLGENHESIHQAQLHTIGNLTLTGYNSELSNSDFFKKRQLFGESRIGLNVWFQTRTVWDDEAIRNRGEMLADRALAVWPYFGKAQAVAPESTSRTTGRAPIRLVILEQVIPVRTWREVLLRTLQFISDLDKEGYKRVVEAYPHYISLERTNLRDARQLDNGHYIETNMSAEAINRFCRQVVNIAGLSPDDWFVETIER